jgi:hypothetical protein
MAQTRLGRNDQSHLDKSKIEAMIQTAAAGQELYRDVSVNEISPV